MVWALVSAGASVDQAREDGTTPLYVAAQQGHLKVVRALVEANATVDQAAENGATPLSVATMQSHLEVAQVLVDAGATLDTARALPTAGGARGGNGNGGMCFSRSAAPSSPSWPGSP